MARSFDHIFIFSFVGLKKKIYTYILKEILIKNIMHCKVLCPALHSNKIILKLKEIRQLF